MKLSNLRIVICGLLIAGLVACGKNKSDSGASVNGRGRAAAAPTAPSVLNNQGQQVASQMFYVIGSDYTQFQENVKILVSPTVDPEEVGTVDPRTGIQMAGSVKYNSSGAVTSDSQIQLRIQDTGGSSSEPIEINLSNGSGTAYNGQFNLSFSDEYGTITVTGRFTSSAGGTANGTVSFTNTSTEYNGRKSGTLGTFTVATCGFFSCGTN